MSPPRPLQPTPAVTAPLPPLRPLPAHCGPLFQCSSSLPPPPTPTPPSHSRLELIEKAFNELADAFHVIADVKGTHGDNMLGMTTLQKSLVDNYEQHSVKRKLTSAEMCTVNSVFAGLLKDLCDPQLAENLPREPARLSLGEVEPGNVDVMQDMSQHGLPDISVSYNDIRDCCAADLDKISDLVLRNFNDKAEGMSDEDWATGMGDWLTKGPDYIVLAGGACQLRPVREAVISGLVSAMMHAKNVIPGMPDWDTTIVYLNPEQATTQVRGVARNQCLCCCAAMVVQRQACVAPPTTPPPPLPAKVAKGNALVAALSERKQMKDGKTMTAYITSRTNFDLRVIATIPAMGNQPEHDRLVPVMHHGSEIGKDYPSLEDLLTNMDIEPFCNSRDLKLSRLCSLTSSGTCKSNLEGKKCERSDCDSCLVFDFYESNR